LGLVQGHVRPGADAFSLHEGRATIAEVSDTCGAGCGLTGFTGIEMLPKYAELMLDQAAEDRYFQLVFHEFGRSFFFFRDPLGQLDALRASPPASGMSCRCRSTECCAGSSPA
jgi:hypothetical protein